MDIIHQKFYIEWIILKLFHPSEYGHYKHLPTRLVFMLSIKLKIICMLESIESALLLANEQRIVFSDSQLF